MGYGPKRDSFTGEEVPGYDPRLHNLLSIFPPFSQSSSITPGGGNESRWEPNLMRFLTGLNLRPEERARALYYAERFGGR